MKNRFMILNSLLLNHCLSRAAIRLAVFTALCLVGNVWALDNVSYLDTDGEMRTADGVTVIDANGGERTLSTGWYLVRGVFSNDGTITIDGAVHLILENGSDLGVEGSSENAGINVSEGNSLSIYAQSTGDNMGKLTATGGGSGAGIGGGSGWRGNGYSGNGGTITISGGAVTAYSSSFGAGIGGGHSGSGGTVTITGGTVTATGGIYSTGIGGGWNGSSGTFTLDGNAVVLTSRISATGENRILKSGILFIFDIGTGTIFEGTPVTEHFPAEGMTAAWKNQGGKNGIAYASGNKTSFIEVPSVTLIEHNLINNVSYIDTNGETQTANNVTVLDDDNISEIDNLNGWFLVRGNNLTRNATLRISGEAHIILEDGSNLAVTTGSFDNSGINVSENNSLAIYAQSTGDNMGKLTVTSYGYNAGIGGGTDSRNCGTVTITGGTVTATGGNGAGIGGGFNGSGGIITITGGAVTATGGNGYYGGAGIGGGSNGSGGTITITSGTVKATSNGGAGIGGYGSTVALDGNATVFASSVSTTDGNLTFKNGILFIFDIGTGTIFEDTPVTEHFPAEGMTAAWKNQGGKSGIAYASGNKTGFLEVSGVTVIECIFINNVSYIDTNGETQTANNVIVLGEDNIAAIDNLNGWFLVRGNNLKRNVTLRISGEAHIILEDGSNLAVTGSYENAGINVSEGNSLTIYAQSVGEDTGKLTATGGNYGAGIGGGDDNYNGNGGTVTITGGTVTATGGRYGAGIGGRGGTVTITITGGTVTATGGNYGIGSDGTITITGGTVTATGGNYGAGIGGGFNNCGGTVTLDGNAVVFASSVSKCGENRILKSSILFIFDIGTGTILEGTPVTEHFPAEGMTAAWKNQGGKSGIDYASGNKTGFLEVSGVTVIERIFINNVSYIDTNGETQTANNVIVLGEDNIAAIDNLNGWFLVRGNNLTRSATLRISGEAHIILENGSDLAVTGSWNNAGINVSEGNSLSIYAQSTGDNMGKLTATGGSGSAGIGGGDYDDNVGTVTIAGGTVTATGSSGSAGIGGGWGSSGGTLTITGGTVMVTGGKRGAGIGGGSQGGNGGTITITGGTVTVTGGSDDYDYGGGAGIGGGWGYDGSGGTITISGGTVTATGGFGSAGIGGGYGSSSGTITISGGIVTATGGGTVTATGISGAGIGGSRGDGDTINTITISGGTVTATGGRNGIESDGTITISGGTVTATGSSYGVGIGSRTVVTISGGAVTATSSSYGVGIGGLTFIMDGNAVVFTNRVNATGENRILKSGILFIGNTGNVYGSMELQENLEVENGYTLTISENATLTIPNSITLTNNGKITPANGSAIIINGTVNGENKIDGANAHPSVITKTLTSITLGGTTDLLANTGQEIEYAISQTNDAPATGWQTETTFAGLAEKADYWIFAHSKENTHFAAGTVSAGLRETTLYTYTVIFKDHDGTEIETQTVHHGSAATAPTDLIREGYTFTGWDKAFSNVTGNLTVTALYTINTHTVTFKDYDGTELKIQTVNHGAAATAPTNPTRAGYTFTGWNIAFTHVTSNLTVTALYSEIGAPVTYTVTFLDHNGTVLKIQVVNPGASATAPPNPSRAGYIFTGWDTAFSNITSHLSVTALYSIITHTVIFKDFDGMVLETEIVHHGSSANAPTDPTRAGYTFTGWDKAFSNVTSNLTVTAEYEEITPILPQIATSDHLIIPTQNGINLAANTNATVAVYNLSGKLISRQNYNAGSHSISLGHLPKGVYIVKASQGGGKEILRVAVR